MLWQLRTNVARSCPNLKLAAVRLRLSLPLSVVFEDNGFSLNEYE